MGGRGCRWGRAVVQAWELAVTSRSSGLNDQQAHQRREHRKAKRSPLSPPPSRRINESSCPLTLEMTRKPVDF